MATPGSMFGMSPLDVVQQRIQEQEKMNMLRRQQRSQEGSEFGVFAPLYRAGLGFGDIAGQALTQGVFGQQQDPMLKKAVDIQSVLSGRDVTKAEDLSSISSDLIKMGYNNEAMAAAQQARAISAQEKEFGFKEEELRLRERGVDLQKTQVEQGQERIGIERDQLKANLAKEERQGLLTEAQIRQINAQIANLGNAYEYQVIKGPAGETTGVIAINKKNPKDVQRIAFEDPTAPAAPTAAGNNSSTVTPAMAAAAQAELDRRRPR